MFAARLLAILAALAISAFVALSTAHAQTDGLPEFQFQRAGQIGALHGFQTRD